MAIRTLLLYPLSLSALPIIHSDSPLAYVFAVSIKLIPASIALSIIWIDSLVEVGLAKLSVPRPKGETFTPERPRIL